MSHNNNYHRRNQGSNHRDSYERREYNQRGDYNEQQSYSRRGDDQQMRHQRQSSSGVNNAGDGGVRGPSVDLQKRTLRVTNFHQDVTKELMRELFMQVGPVRNVVLRSDHAFIEFEDENSVGYALAAMDGVQLFSKPLYLEPKIQSGEAYKYLENLRLYEQRPELFHADHHP